MAFHSIQSIGYFLMYSQEHDRDVQCTHIFCGKHHIHGAWCPNCQKSLLRFFSLSLQDKKLDVTMSSSVNYLPLLFCWTCNIAQEQFSYHVITDSKIQILDYKKGGVETNFPYNDYPLYFPKAHVVLEQLPSLTQKIFSQLNSGLISEVDVSELDNTLCKPQHQLGGEPYLIQSELPRVLCPSCKIRMPFLASVGDHCLDKRGFTGNEYVQVLFFLCKECSIISTLQQCD